MPHEMLNEEVVASVTEPTPDELLSEVSKEELPAETSAPSSEEELSNLREEVGRLREALAAKEAEQEKTLRELGEFNRLFPEVSIQSVPDQVWHTVGEGIPLSAAYALYEKKQRMDAARAEQINRQNASRSAGRAGRNTAGEYFSPDEVRAMSQKQVHENYAKIMASMKTWN
ncbi:MAG: hypothetical protein IJW44_02645 [Clostridia bacterium]|nr:hypothetical protein [Clostridia bacterium]